MRRLSELRETILLWHDFDRRASDLQELAALAADEGDEASGAAADIAREAIELEREVEARELELAFAGPYDRSGAIVAVHAGAGGTESQDWAEMLLRMYLRWAERRGYRSQIIDLMAGEEAGIKSVTVEIHGTLAYGYLKHERGVHRLVRISPFDASHSRHTSFALVEVMPEVAEDVAEVEISTDDLRIDVFRASGHGGQNVQKNSTAVRITHIPTGIVVSCQNERSQGRNKETAMRVLQSRLLELELERKAEEQARLKGKHIVAGWGNQIRSYVLQPYRMVKDLRTDCETSNTTAVLDGEIDEFLEASVRASVGETV